MREKSSKLVNFAHKFLSNVFNVDIRKLKRSWIFLKQRKERGFDDSETWSLDYTIAKFALPRLRRFREITIARPYDFEEGKYMDKEKWMQILIDIELFLQYFSLVDDPAKQRDLTNIPNFKERFESGRKYWSEYFCALWW